MNPLDRMTPDALHELIKDEARRGDHADDAELLYADPDSWVHGLEALLAMAEADRDGRAAKLEADLTDPRADHAALRAEHLRKEQGTRHYESVLRRRLALARQVADAQPHRRRRELLTSLRAASAGLVATTHPAGRDTGTDVAVVSSRRLAQLSEVLAALDALDTPDQQLHAI